MPHSRPALHFVVALCGLALLAACGPPPEPGPLVTYDNFCDPKFDLPEGAPGDAPLARLTIGGYLVPPAMFSLCSDTCSFDLAEKFEPSDFKLHTNTDAVLGFGDKARVTGLRLGSSKDNSCTGST